MKKRYAIVTFCLLTILFLSLATECGARTRTPREKVKETLYQLSLTPWSSHYVANVWDCSNMSARLSSILQDQGIDSKILVVEIDRNGEGQVIAHAVITADVGDEIFVIEATELYLHATVEKRPTIQERQQLTLKRGRETEIWTIIDVYANYLEAQKGRWGAEEFSIQRRGEENHNHS